MKKNNFYSLLLLSSVSIFVLSASTNYKSSVADQKRNYPFSAADTIAQERWLAPASADTIKNPLSVTPATVSEGAALYNMYCFACHGDTGYGDGPAGGALGVRPANFHDQNVIKQKDGAFFWKLTNGKGNMPPFKEILKEEQRWQLVSYLRDLGKQQ